jgi:hypothetical protein
VSVRVCLCVSVCVRMYQNGAHTLQQDGVAEGRQLNGGKSLGGHRVHRAHGLQEDVTVEITHALVDIVVSPAADTIRGV